MYGRQGGVVCLVSKNTKKKRRKKCRQQPLVCSVCEAEQRTHRKRKEQNTATQIKAESSFLKNEERVGRVISVHALFDAHARGYGVGRFLSFFFSLFRCMYQSPSLTFPRTRSTPSSPTHTHTHTALSAAPFEPQREGEIRK